MSVSDRWPDLLARLSRGETMSRHEAASVMSDVIRGAVSDARLAALLVSLAQRQETVDEVVGFRDAALEAALPLEVSGPALDIVGTGGDGHRTVNVSTMAAIVAASAGVPVMKHGNRAASSASGSSDVLSALGVNVELSPAEVASVFAEVGISFAFARLFHPGFRHAAGVRSELGVPTVFNLLGPLCNPAQPIANAVGVASAARLELVVGQFVAREASALVFRGEDGLDEMSTSGPSRVIEVVAGERREYYFDPAELGVPRASLDQLRGGSPDENAEIVRRTLAGEGGAVLDIVLVNAAAGIVAFDAAFAVPTESFEERMARGIERARQSVHAGRAIEKLEEWILATQKRVTSKAKAN